MERMFTTRIVNGNWQLLFTLLIAGVVIAILAVFAPAWRGRFARVKPMDPDKHNAPAPEVLKRIREANALADRKIQQAREKRLKEICEFFEERKTGVEKFAECALGLTATWHYVYSWVDGGKALDAYLQKCFQEHLVTEEQCAAKIAQVLNAFVRDIEDIESQMLMELKNDLYDLPAAQSLNIEELQKGISEDFKRGTLQDSVMLSKLVLKKEVNLEVFTSALSELLAQIIANRLPVLITARSIPRLGSMLGKGPGFVPAFVLGILIEYFLDLLVRQMYDPKEEMKKAITEVIDTLQQRIISGGIDQEGSTFKNGLDQELRDFITERSKIRERVILEQLGVNP